MPSTPGPAARREVLRSRLAASLPVVIFAAGLALMSGLQARYRPFAIDGLYFQEHSSEDMM